MDTAIQQAEGSDLATLAAAINREHGHATAAAKTALEHARRCGEYLLQAKAEVGHGGFLKWLQANCRVGDRQARRYMRVAEHWPAIEAKTDAASDLTIAGALRAIGDTGQPGQRPRPGELALPFGFTWRLESNHITLVTPSGSEATLYMTGARFADDMTLTEHQQCLHVLMLFGDSLWMQLATRGAA